MPIEDKIFDSVLASLPNLTGKCYAITGSTSGTGLWTAMAAVRKGAACVILLNRSSERARAAQEKIAAVSSNTKVISVDCDLQSFASVRSAADSASKLSADFGGLDGLINNAGIMAVPDERTGDGHDVQMQSNHLSHFLFTKLMLPSLEAAAASRGEARIVQHSSGARSKLRAEGDGTLEERFFKVSEAGTLGGNGMSACFNRYHQTKLANSVFAMSLHHRLSAAGSKVKSLCAEPGVSATSLAQNMAAGHTKAPKTDKPPGSGASKAVGAPPMNFKPQSAADGACPLMEASFGSTANSGDFYMPGDMIEGTPVGMPVKCMTSGHPTPTSESMAKRFKNEELTMHEASRLLLWNSSEQATEQFNVTGLSKL